MVGTDGKILLDKEGIIKEAADGHGGIFEAMFKNNVVEDMKNNGVEWIFVGPVDNPLVKMVDEILIGVAVDKKSISNRKIISKSKS
jgi:UDP-N-acetylglucosamine pyrophosphorylase